MKFRFVTFDFDTDENNQAKFLFSIIYCLCLAVCSYFILFCFVISRIYRLGIKEEGGKSKVNCRSS